MLEALVALVLISSIGFALLAWVQQNLDTLQRLRGHYEELEARRVVLDWAATLNPMQEPQGKISRQGVEIDWSSEQLGNTLSQSGYPRGVGLYDVAVYKVSIVVHREKVAEPWFREDLTRTGYNKARSSKSFLQ